MKKSNRGLTLIELIVAMAIFAIAGIAISAFIVFATRNFATSNTNVKLQYEQQIVVNRVRDMILETSRGVNYNETDNKLLIMSDNPDTTFDSNGKPINPCMITEIRLDAEENKLYTASFPVGKDFKLSDGLSFGNEVLISDNVSKFSLNLDELENGKVTLNIAFIVGEREVEVNPVIALRNMIKKVDEEISFDEYYEGDVIEFYSHVASVTIYRDGKPFGLNRTDTIQMAGDVTSAKYDAEVKKKKNYTESINTDVTWSIDLSTVKDGYQDYISIDSNGKVTLKKKTETVNGTQIVKGPLDYMNGNYFVIIATSVEDNSKEARLRIKVKDGGVYPVSINLSKTTEKKDLSTGQLIYNFEYSILYTGRIEDETRPGTMVNPLDGKGAYTKITMRVDTEKGDNPPEGAGLNPTGNVDGSFVVSKSMEGHTYVIIAEVMQRDKQGEPVKVEHSITIPKGAVPPIKEVSVPVILAASPALRGTDNAVSAQWSSGSPTYSVTLKESNDQMAKEEKRYYYWFVWEMEKNPDDFEANWKTGEKDSFNNVYFKYKENWQNKTGHKFTSSQVDSIAVTYINSYLDWKKTFTYKIRLRVKISKTEKYEDAQWFMLPESDEEDEYGNLTIMTDVEAKAYSTEQVIVVEPVTLTLVGKRTRFFRYFDVGQKIDMETTYLPRDAEKAEEKYLLKIGKRTDGIGSWDVRYDERRSYYVSFSPVFTGISMNQSNVAKNLTGNEWDNPIFGASSLPKNVNGSATLQPYTLINGRYEYKNDVADSAYQVGMLVNKNIDNQLYVYVKITPLGFWDGISQRPLGARWMCVLKDYKNNTVTARFQDTGNEYLNFPIPSDIDFDDLYE
ncbi:MAG: prepilin-type N-terminal cleavage/methylation domain-containing protein [Lachnospiraceae bacterium]|nr:prepilin-type N-terminal cleavage/methylation domain-containing protein [Lachnospiraceae bacterium]